MENLKVILTEEQIQNRVRELGETITNDYKGKFPHCICVLKGANTFFSDLIKRLNLNITVDFVKISSYKNGTVSNDIELVNGLTDAVKDRDVLIVDDVLDSGKTLNYFVDELKKQRPTSVKTCVFLNKPERREIDVSADYVGFNINCGFVVGYGMDYAERFRNLPYLAELL